MSSEVYIVVPTAELQQKVLNFLQTQLRGYIEVYKIDTSIFTAGSVINDTIGASTTDLFYGTDVKGFAVGLNVGGIREPSGSLIYQALVIPAIALGLDCIYVNNVQVELHISDKPVNHYTAGRIDCDNTGFSPLHRFDAPILEAYNVSLEHGNLQLKAEAARLSSLFAAM